MVEIKKMDLDKNEVMFDDYSTVNYEKFYDTFVSFWNKRIAGETISPFDIERFMKRGSSKNLDQLCRAKKTEGYLEASIGKKVDPGLMKIIIIGVVVGAIIFIAVYLMKQMGVF